MIIASTSQDLSERIIYLEKGIRAFEEFKVSQEGGDARALGNSIRGLKETLKACKELEELKASVGESDDEMSHLKYIW